MTPSPDNERDAWLREALRHAPDAQAGPPASLSELILREAQAKARGRSPDAKRPPAPSAGLGVLWAWLARPPVAAGFASVMVAVLAGLMWWNQPLEESVSRPMASAPAASPVAIAEAPAEPVDSATPMKPPTPKAAASANAPTTRRPAERARAPTLADAAPGTHATEVTAAAPPQPAPVPAAPATMAQGGEAREQAPAVAARKSVEGKAGGSLSTRPSPGHPSEAAMASLRASLTAEPQRWSWQRDNASAQPMSDQVQAWLAQLDAATSARWQRSSAAATEQAPGTTPSIELRLLRDGRVLHSFQLEGSTLRWDAARAGDAFALALQARLSAASAHALLQAAP